LYNVIGQVIPKTNFEFVENNLLKITLKDNLQGIVFVSLMDKGTVATQAVHVLRL
jgi:hypothetical protein